MIIRPLCAIVTERLKNLLEAVLVVVHVLGPEDQGSLGGVGHQEAEGRLVHLTPEPAPVGRQLALDPAGFGAVWRVLDEPQPFLN